MYIIKRDEGKNFVERLKSLIWDREKYVDDCEYILKVGRVFNKGEFDDVLTQYDDDDSQEINQILVDDFVDWYTDIAFKDEAYKRMAELYEDEELQQLVSKYGYDKRKFWFLLCYIKHYVDYYNKMVRLKPYNLRKELEQVIKLLNQKETVIIIRNGDEKLIIDSPESLFFFSDALDNTLNNEYYEPYLKEGKIFAEPTANLKIAFFVAMFDCFTEASKSNRRKWWFISKLLYAAGYLKEEKYFYEDKIDSYNKKTKEFEQSKAYIGLKIKEKIKDYYNNYNYHEFAFYTNFHLSDKHLDDELQYIFDSIENNK